MQERNDLRQKIARLDDFIQSRKEWQDLSQHPTWAVLLKALSRLRYKALLDLGNAKSEEMAEFKALYDAICLVCMMIDQHTDFNDLENALLQKELTVAEIEDLDKEEDFEKRTTQIGGLI